MGTKNSPGSNGGMTETRLVNYEAAKTALAAAVRVDDVKKIRKMSLWRPKLMHGRLRTRLL
jgi:hypothetical protein